MLFHPTNPLMTKITFDFLLQNSIKNNSPTDLEKQTAIASKDKGFFDKALALSILTTLVNAPPILASLASHVMVCV